MKPRITINTSKDGELQIWVNPAGGDRLVEELESLNERNDHFHLHAEEFAIQVALQTIPYCPDDTIIDSAKVFYRPDGWDAEHFPHVLGENVHKD